MKFTIVTIIAAVAIADSASANPSKSITFSGGGFRAHATGSGVMAGMLSVAAGNTSDTSFQDLMQNFENIAANSGGTWFTAQFIYSANFQQLLEDMAAASGNHFDVASLYAGRWVDKFLWETKISSSHNQEVENIGLEANDIITTLLRLLGDFTSWARLIVNYFKAKNVSWRSFVHTMMQVPGDLDPNMSLSEAPANPWAHSKRYVVGGAIVEPTPLQQHRSTSGAYQRTCTDENGHQVVRSVSYECQYQGAGRSSPITFSTFLGNQSSENMESPYPFYHPDMSNGPRRVDYLLQNQSQWFNFGDILEIVQTKRSPITGPGMYSNRVSIGDVAATSSAFLSQAISVYDAIEGIALTLKSLRIFDFLTGFMMPAALKQDVEPISMFDKGFQHARPQKEKKCDEWFNEIISDEVMTLADGGYVDNSAISNILASAQDGDEYTLVLNSNDLIVNDINRLFQGNPELGVFFTHAPVFQEDQDYAIRVQENLQRLNVHRDAKVLKDISYGSFEAVTAAQPFYGVSEGKKVTVHVILVTSTMEIAPLSWTEPSLLAADIVSTLNSVENKDAAQYILKTFF